MTEEGLRISARGARTDSASDERLAAFWEKLRTRAALAAAASLCAVGLSLCLFLGQWLQVPAGDVVLWTLAVTLTLCVVAYNRYTLLGAALLLGIGAFAVWRMLEPEELTLLWEYITVNLNASAGFLFRAEPFSEEYAWTLYAVLIASCSFLSMLLAYRLRSAAATSLLCIVIFLVEWNLSGDHVLPALWPAMVGCCALLSVRGFRFAPASAWQTVALASAIALIGCGISAAVVPGNTQGLRIPFIERALDNVNDLLSDYTGFQRSHGSFSIASFGYQPLGDRLGGAVSLPDHDVLRINSITPRLLRGTVRNYYTGQSWVRSASIRTYRLGNPLIGDRQDAIMGVDIPPVTDEELEELLGSELQERFSREINVSVTHLTDMNATIFTAGKVRSFRSADSGLIANFDENSEAFSKRPIPIGTGYTAPARVPLTGLATFPLAAKRLYESGLLPETPQEVRERNAFLYLGLPGDYPRWIIDRSLEIVEGAQNDYEKATALMEYLRENFTYTLTPETPPEDADFVEYFLTSGEGYCTYYASAMAVMARAVDLPSRYVEGFLLETSRRGASNYTVTANQAHAWAEVYLEGIGWLPFDATPSQARPQVQAFTTAYMPEITPEPTPVSDGLETITFFRRGGIPWWVYAALPVAAAVALLIFLLRRQENRWASERLEVRYPDPRERMLAIWRDILSSLGLYGIALKAGETPFTYAGRVDEAVENPEGKLRSIAESFVRSRYGQIAPDDTQLGRANAYRGELDLQLKRSMGTVRYIFARTLKRMPTT